MTSVTVHNPLDTDAKGSSVELPAELFDVTPNIPLIHQVVVAQLGAARQGTHSTKTRSDVRGGGRKPYRQKGTGRARQGSTRAPQFAGGGTVHGPHPRSYEQRTPKKMKAAALRGALSDRARHDRVHVVTALLDGDAPSTREAVTALAKVTEARNVLVVLATGDDVTWKSLRNVADVHLLDAGQLNTYDVLTNDDIVFTQDALNEFVAARGLAELEFSDAKPAKKAAKKSAPAKSASKTTAAKATGKASKADEADDARDFGPDSHAALADGSEPEGFPIKGNADSMLYHVPGSAFYERTEAEVWFKTAEAAEAAGFELPPSQRDDADKNEDD